MIAIVAAHDGNRVIGAGGGLPWHLPTDLRRFRELTLGRAVVMGRRTYDSLPDAFRPLPGRRNLVLSSQAGYEPEGAEAYPSLPEALDACSGDCFVIGGERVFADALPFADRLYLTEVDSFGEGDAFFPALPSDWRCVEESEPVDENGHRFVFRVYERA